MATPLKIIIIEDHDALRLMLVQHLLTRGYQVVGLDSGAQLNEHLQTEVPDLLVLDVNLPVESGLEIAKRIRKSHNRIRIIMLTAYTSESDRVNGYDSGADIYLTKPVSIAELEASIGSIARRHIEPALASDVLYIYQIEMRIAFNNLKADVSRQEISILKALAEAPSQFLPAWSLLENLGKVTDQKNRAALDVAITRLRKKLVSISGNENALKVSRGAGYQLTIKSQME